MKQIPAEYALLPEVQLAVGLCRRRTALLMRECHSYCKIGTRPCILREEIPSAPTSYTRILRGNPILVSKPPTLMPTNTRIPDRHYFQLVRVQARLGRQWGEKVSVGRALERILLVSGTPTPCQIVKGETTVVSIGGTFSETLRLHCEEICCTFKEMLCYLAETGDSIIK